jgi:glycosyltransferase involved in cell wall biosynthesis
MSQTETPPDVKNITETGNGGDQGLLSIIVPAYNESEVINVFHERLTAALQPVAMRIEIVYVNDGSKDNTLDLLQQLRAKDKKVAIVNLSRNFGKEIAMSAGLDYVQGDAVVVIDADLQDPPELIPKMVEQWQQGYDMVYAQRTERAGESWFKKFTARNFYRLMNQTSNIDVPVDTGDFRILSRRAVDALTQLKEQHRFMKGLFSWIGYKQKAIPYARDARAAGTTSWNYWKLWNFALEGVTSFSLSPLKLAVYLGLLVAIVAFTVGIIVITKTLIYGDPVAGYPSLMVAVLFLGGVQLLAIGILGEYLGRMFDESKQRPLYFVQDYLPSESTNDQSE